MQTPHIHARTFVAGLIVAQGGLALTGVVLTLAYFYEVLVLAPSDAPVALLLLLCGCFLPQLALSTRARSLTTPAPRRRLVVAFVAASLLAVFGAVVFFQVPAHDIALWFGSHGRFGCTTVDASGHRTTWLDDRTLPWLLSLPIPLLWAIWLSRPKPAHPPE
jgi:hypothetical protein